MKSKHWLKTTQIDEPTYQETDQQEISTISCIVRLEESDPPAAGMENINN
jgi:hypothetical protein